MTDQVTQIDRPTEPPDRWHPQYDSFTEWLDAEARANETPAVTDSMSRAPGFLPPLPGAARHQ